MRTLMTTVACAAVVCAAVCGCTINIGGQTLPSTAKVSKEDLQKDISGRLANIGGVPQSVTCPEDLIGEVGTTTRCDVTTSAANSFEPIVTVISVQGAKVDYDITPSVSKTQLEAAVSQQVASTSKAPVDSVSCESGLDGTVGAQAHCAVTAAGVPSQRTVEVTAVSGLSMSYTVVPVLPKAVVEASLVFQLRQVGQHPDSATCVGDLEGKIGSTVECATQSAGLTQSYVLTVTAVPGGNITYKYALKI